MKISSCICLSAAVLALAGPLTACASAGVAADPAANHPRPHWRGPVAPHRAAGTEDRNIAGSKRAPQPAAPQAAWTRSATEDVFWPITQAESVTAAPHSQPPRLTSPIGLFGEHISDTGPRAQPQGRGNIAQVSFLAEGGAFDPAVDRTGKRIAFASTMHQTGANLYIKTIGGSTITQLTSDPADDVMPTFNPAGDKIAFASNRGGKWDIYIMSVDGGPPVQLTNDNDHEIHPTWSPDGRHLAYCKFNSKSGRWEIWALDVESPGVKRFLDYGMFPKWSPDVASNKILFQRPRQRGSRLHGIWTIDYVNGEALRPTEIVSAANAATINPAWSPDGRRIVFVTVVDPDQCPADGPELADLWVVNVDGGGRVKVTDGQFANFQPVWARDGHIYFISNRSGIDNIWAIATDRVIDLTAPGATGIAGAPTDR